MYSGRKHSHQKKGLPFALIAALCTIILTVIVYTTTPLREDIIMSYLLSINATTFLFFGLDKILAAQQSQRVPEKVLFGSSLFGGSAAALVAMHFFRHKTQKGSFQATLGGILLLQILLIVIVYNSM